MLMRIAALLLALLAMPACNAQGLLEKYQPGNHYFLIEPPQPTTSGKQVEVMEVFSYACPHCAHFQPEVDKWKARMPATAKLVYLPAAWNPAWELVARAYYAAVKLGIIDKTHKAFYDALHVEHVALNSNQDLANWYAKFGVSADAFLAAMNSPETDTQIARSKTLVPLLFVDGTPTVIVAGKYRVTGASAAGYEHVFEVVDFLVAKEASSRK